MLTKILLFLIIWGGVLTLFYAFCTERDKIFFKSCKLVAGLIVIPLSAIALLVYMILKLILF